MSRSNDIASRSDAGEVISHIKPDVLYPAVAGKLLDGTTSHSGNYGTSQSDSRKYYYTDIKGSKPIRDPRIGAHFGSQRHKFKSLQLLEQETATHGKDVHSVDGRENIRVVGEHYEIANNANGHNLILWRSDYTDNNGHFLEVTGYFSDANFIQQTWSDVADGSDVYIDGTLVESNRTARTSASSPLISRYVDSGSVFRAFDTSQTLGIHTLKYTWVNSAGTTNAYQYLFGIELIAQDTTSSTTRNQIQIPSQTVVSFGSKFSLSASTPHHHPFSAKSDGTAWTSPTSGTNNANSSAEWPSIIDTATSLGLAKWVNGSNYYRPYNGARVVKWVDENGEIKTSVTVMPPNAKSIADSGTLSNATAKSNGSAPNDNYRPTFEAHTSNIDEDLLSEVAKTFHYREFGNGSANGGTGGTYADASMVASADDIGYCMDDGLTSISGKGATWNSSENIKLNDHDDYFYFTFIGTGLTINVNQNGTLRTVAQNLPYGTHICHLKRYSNNAGTITIDGVTLQSQSTNWDRGLIWDDITFHQPKRPPIPEDACILADYMLMADFVSQPSTLVNGSIPKGCRAISGSRDCFYTGGVSVNTTVDVRYLWGLVGAMGLVKSGTNHMTINLPFFGTRAVAQVQHSHSDDWTFNFDGSTGVAHTHLDNATSAHHDGALINATADLGLTNVGAKAIDNFNFGGFYVHTPIHTSSHYQSFETPFLHELIGGDRNMEQTHLICSADGKTWDEVTRDTSYLGPRCSFTATRDGGHVSSGNYYIFDYFRGRDEGVNYHNKGFAIAYDKILFLEDGYYRVFLQLTSSSNGGAWRAKLRHGYGDHIQMNQDPDPNEPNSDTCTTIIHATRGDWFWVYIEVGTVNGTTRIRSRVTAEKLDY